MNFNLLILALCIAPLLILALRSLRKSGRARAEFLNVAELTHEQGEITKKTDGTTSSRFLLVKFGADVDHVTVAGAADTAVLGVCTDDSPTAEEPVNVSLLAASGGTVKCQTDGSGAIVQGDYLVPAASGQVKKLAAGAGNYYIVGMALTAPVTAAGEVFEVMPLGGFKTQ